MRFVVTSKSVHPVPPEMLIGLLDAMTAWVNRYKAAGKLEVVWGNAGAPGGGGILNVESAEELHAMVLEQPFLPFSETQIMPIVDLIESIQQAKRAIQAMMPGGGS